MNRIQELSRKIARGLIVVPPEEPLQRRPRRDRTPPRTGVPAKPATERGRS
jgi:hypothetical protein